MSICRCDIDSYVFETYMIAENIQYSNYRCKFKGVKDNYTRFLLNYGIKKRLNVLKLPKYVMNEHKLYDNGRVQVMCEAYVTWDNQYVLLYSPSMDEMPDVEKLVNSGWREYNQVLCIMCKTFIKVVQSISRDRR